MSAIAEAILPETETPGAKQAKVSEFIDFMLANWFSVEETKQFIKEFDQLLLSAKTLDGTSLWNWDGSALSNFVSRLDEETWNARQRGDDDLPIFAQIKELTIIGYYTSAIGASSELNIFGPIAVAGFGASGPPSGLTSY